MGKWIIIAEEGERGLIDKAREILGEDVLPKTEEQGGEAKVLVTGVGAINIIRALQDLPREAELLTSAMPVVPISILAHGSK